MKVKEMREAYYGATGQTSSIVRQLALAGLAVVWLIGGGLNRNDGKIALTPWLIAVAVIFVIALFCDLLQYVAKSAIWGFYSLVMEYTLSPADQREKDIAAPNWLNWAPLALFWLKIIIMLVGYLALALDLGRRI